MANKWCLPNSLYLKNPFSLFYFCHISFWISLKSFFKKQCLVFLMNWICSLQAFIPINCFFLYPTTPFHCMTDLFFKLSSISRDIFLPLLCSYEGCWVHHCYCLSQGDWVTFWMKPVPSGLSQELMVLINHGLVFCFCFGGGCWFFVSVWVFVRLGFFGAFLCVLFLFHFESPACRPVAFLLSNKQWAK